MVCLWVLSWFTPGSSGISTNYVYIDEHIAHILQISGGNIIMKSLVVQVFTYNSYVDRFCTDLQEQDHLTRCCQKI